MSLEEEALTEIVSKRKEEHTNKKVSIQLESLSINRADVRDVVSHTDWLLCLHTGGTDSPNCSPGVILTEDVFIPERRVIIIEDNRRYGDVQKEESGGFKKGTLKDLKMYTYQFNEYQFFP